MGLLDRLLGRQGIELDQLLEVVPNYFESRFGPIDKVFHEIVSDAVHLDVHLIMPNAKCEHIVIFTTGMSMRKMKGEVPFGEMVMFLSADWPLDDLEDEANYWPIRYLKTWARLHVSDGFRVKPFLSMPFGLHGEVAAGTRFDATMSLDLNVARADCGPIILGDKAILPMLIVPLMPEETAFKVSLGEPDGLWRELQARGADLRDFLVVSPDRASLI
jgi:hypothetical protein